MAEPAKSKPARMGGGAALAAAMLAVGEILEPEKTQVEITQLDDSDFDPDLEFELHFGHLDPLD